MQIFLTVYICVISQQKERPTLLYFGQHCALYFLPHQLGTLKLLLSTGTQCLADMCV